MDKCGFWNTAASINWKLYLCYKAVSYFRLFICVWSSSSSQLMFLLEPRMVNKICEDLSDMYLQCSYILFCVHFQTNSSLVWKKIKILTTCFPNQFQFGLEKNYNFDDSFSKPIPVWFGKNDHFSETKNSRLIPRFFGKTLKRIYFFLFSKFEIIFCFKMSRNWCKIRMFNAVPCYSIGLRINDYNDCFDCCFQLS